MKNLAILLSAACLFLLASVAGASPVQVEAQEATAPSQEELLEDLFGVDHHVASCTIAECGNTGNHYGYGSSCQAAKDALDANLYATATDICNGGLVTSVDITYGSCVLALRQYRYSGNADVQCKLCNGQVCLFYS